MRYETLNQKVVMITGASSGLGASLAKGFAREGSVVYAAARNKERLDTVIESIRSEGFNATSVVLDVTKSEQVNEAAEKMYDQQDRIDVWINNAGVGYSGRFLEMSDEKMKELIDVNQLGFLYGMKAAGKYMIEKRQGCIVQILSTSSRIARSSELAYCTAKAGAAMAAECLQKELEDYGIRTMNFYPGAIETDFQKNAGLPESPNRLNPDTLADLMLHCISLPRGYRINMELLRTPPSASK